MPATMAAALLPNPLAKGIWLSIFICRAGKFTPSASATNLATSRIKFFSVVGSVVEP